jgi:hypothetical protein
MMSTFSNISRTLFVLTLMLVLLICPSKYVIAQIPAPARNVSMTGIQFLIYENSSLGLQIQYPSNWKKVDDSGNITFYPMPRSSPSNAPYPQLHILVSRTHEQSLNQSANKLVSNYSKSVTGFRLIKLAAANTNGLLSEVILYTSIDPKFGLVKTAYVLLTNNEKNYYISYKANSRDFSSYLPVVYSVISSVRILAPGGLGQEGVFLGTTLSTLGPSSRGGVSGFVPMPVSPLAVLLNLPQPK